MSGAGMLGRTGRCKSFDNSANGDLITIFSDVFHSPSRHVGQMYTWLCQEVLISMALGEGIAIAFGSDISHRVRKCKNQNSQPMELVALQLFERKGIQFESGCDIELS